MAFASVFVQNHDFQEFHLKIYRFSLKKIIFYLQNLQKHGIIITSAVFMQDEKYSKQGGTTWKIQQRKKYLLPDLLHSLKKAVIP